MELLIDGDQAVMGTQAITLERSNPLLEFETLRGSKILDFVLPDNPTNNAIFGNFGNMQVAFKFKDYFSEQFMDGRLTERGFVSLKNVGSNGFTVFYTQNFGELFGDYQDTLLTELPLGNEVIPGTLPTNPSVATAKYCFPRINNPGFYGTNGGVVGYSGHVNDHDGTNFMPGPKVPFLFVRFLLERITQVTGVKFSGDFLTDAILSRLVLYNVHSLDGLTEIAYSNHLPELTLRQFLIELRKAFNLAVWVDVFRKRVTLNFADEYFGRSVQKDWSNKFPELKFKSPEFSNRLEIDMMVDTSDAKMKPIPSGFERYASPSTNERDQLFKIATAFSGVLEENGQLKTDQVGRSDQFSQGAVRNAPRFCFWSGLDAGVPTSKNTYGGVSLTPTGIKNAYFSAYEKFRSKTYSVTTPATLNALDIADLDMHRKQGETVAVHIQGQNYMIGKQLIPDNSTQQSNLELWRV
jgi:hypothetical protein